MEVIEVEKELEKIVRTETITVYKAFDSTEFSDLTECRNYELKNRFKKDESTTDTRYTVNSSEDFYDLINLLEYPGDIHDIHLYVDARSTVNLDRFTYPMHIFSVDYYESDWGKNSMYMQTLSYKIEQAKLKLAVAKAELATLQVMLQ